MQVTIDLKKYQTKKARLICGHDRGDEVRKKTGINEMILRGDDVIINVPGDIIALCAGFIDNFIFDVALFLGSKEEFHKRVKFVWLKEDGDPNFFLEDVNEALSNIFRDPDYLPFRIEKVHTETSKVLHEKAMYYFEESIVNNARKEFELEKENLKKAYQFEVECIEVLRNHSNANPTRAIVCASCAAIAFRLGRYLNAYFYANEAINITQDKDLIEELVELKRDMIKLCK